MKYEVIVGNIGTVYSGSDGPMAAQVYDEYLTQSKIHYGRASMESVILMKDNEIIMEYVGEIEAES